MCLGQERKLLLSSSFRQQVSSLLQQSASPTHLHCLVDELTEEWTSDDPGKGAESKEDVKESPRAENLVEPGERLYPGR